MATSVTNRGRTIVGERISARAWASTWTSKGSLQNKLRYHLAFHNSMHAHPVLLIPLAGRKAIRILLGLVVAVYLIRQARKPSKWVGRPFLWMMNARHSDLTDWGLGHVQLGNEFTMLDVGCGGGRTIQKLAALAAGGKVCGADYATGSVFAARAKNASLIEAGRTAIVQASVSSLPFAHGAFDMVTAIETQYYWPNMLEDMNEVRRVLRPGGKLIVIAEAYKSANDFPPERWLMQSLGTGYLSVAEQKELFSKAGYIDVQVYEERRRKWICVLGTKPSN